VQEAIHADVCGAIVEAGIGLFGVGVITNLHAIVHKTIAARSDAAVIQATVRLLQVTVVTRFNALVE
jgi:hypothetical protein